MANDQIYKEKHDIESKHSSLIELVLSFISLSFILIDYFNRNNDESNTKTQSTINDNNLEDYKKVKSLF